MSEIVSATIDAEYPVAGVDNDTQGFRDNFSIIKTGLSTAKQEIDLLQDNTAKLDENNNFNGTQIADAELALVTEKYYNAGTKTTGDNISFLNGHYQRVAINLNDNATPGNITFNLADWPDREGYAKITVEFFGSGAELDESVLHQINLTVEGGGTLKKSSNFPSTFQIDSVANRADGGDPIIVEFWTTNQGNTVYANYLGVFA